MKVFFSTLVLLYMRRSASLSSTIMSMSSSSNSNSNTMLELSNQISVRHAGFHLVNGVYDVRPSTQIPSGFDKTCRAMNWDTEQMWNQLSDPNRSWYELEENGSYMYYNRGDSHWWMDGPSGAGVYIVKSDGLTPPSSGWKSLHGDFEPIPKVDVVEDIRRNDDDL